MHSHATTFPGASNVHAGSTSSARGEGGGGSGATGRYDSLLVQVQQVQQELQLARVVIQQLRQDNETLKENWETCRSELVNTRHKYNHAKEQLLGATERQIKVDRKHETLVESWKQQLKVRTTELEALQAKLVPQNLDLLRIKIQEELEAPHLLKLAEMEGELRKWEALFYSVRRAYEKDKAEHALFREQMQASILSDRGVFDAEVAELNRRIREAEERQNDTTLDESLLSAQQETAASAVRERRLLAEINELRTEANEMSRKHQAQMSAIVEKCSKAEASLAASEADNHSHQHRNAQALARVADLEAEVSSLRESQHEARLDADYRKQELDLREKKLMEDDRRRNRELDRARQALELDRRQLEGDLRGEIQAAKEKQRVAEQKELLADERVARALATEEETRQATRHAIDASEAVAVELRVEIAELASQLKAQQYESESTHSLLFFRCVYRVR